MPIISSNEEKKNEKINELKVASEKILDNLDSNFKQLQNKRLENAKKIAKLSILGLTLSSLLFFFFDKEIGIFAGIIFSSIPSVVNLIDD